MHFWRNQATDYCSKNLQKKKKQLVSLLKMSLYDLRFEFLLMQITYLISPYVEYQLQIG